jgi:hypothetical protein
MERLIMFDVTCLGILVSDVVAKTVDQIPEKGKLLPIEQISLHTGGCATNTAIDLAKLGFKPAIIGKVGKDGFGEHLINSLSSYKVNIDGLVIKEGINTSASVVLSSHDGERTFLHCFGANADFMYDDINFNIIKNILLPREIRSASNFSILECRNILIEYIDFFKTNISDEQITLVKNLQNHGFENNKGGKYDQYTLSFDEKQFNDLYSAFIEMLFKDERLVNITVDNVINIFELFENAGYFELFSDFKPFTEKILSYSDYSTLKEDLLNLLENVQFPDGLNMKIVVDSAGNVIARDINVSSKQPDYPVRIYDIFVGEKYVSGIIEQPSEDGKDNASIEFKFQEKNSNKFEGSIKCINNIWPDFEAKISTLSESSENVKKKLISTNNKLLVEFDVEEYGIKDANVLIDIRREDRYDESFDMPQTDNDSAINLNTVSDEKLKDVIKELQFSAAKFMLNNQDLIEPFINIDEK